MTRLLLILLILPSCAGFEAVAEVLSDPAVQEGLTQTATSAATGNLSGVLWGLAATVAAVCVYRKLKKGSPKP